MKKTKKPAAKKQYEYASQFLKHFVTSNFGTKAFGSNKYSRKQKHKKQYAGGDY